MIEQGAVGENHSQDRQVSTIFFDPFTLART
jgi:hypothetical protein